MCKEGHFFVFVVFNSLPFADSKFIIYLFIYLFWSFCLLRPVPAAYGGSQASG